jgi:DNA repair protein RadC
MQAHFSFLGDDHNDSAASGEALKEAAALYLDPRNRLPANGPDALTDADTLSLLLGERDHLLATRLLLDFGSLTALSRASLVQLLPFLNREKAMRLLCAFRLASLCGYQVAQHPLDSPDRIYNLFAGELIQADREILAGALIDTRFRLLKKVQISVGTLNETLAHPREIFKAAIAYSAYGLVLVHITQSSFWGRDSQRIRHPADSQARRRSPDFANQHARSCDYRPTLRRPARLFQLQRSRAFVKRVPRSLRGIPFQILMRNSGPRSPFAPTLPERHTKPA